jgi:RNA polymerase sigma-70 factor (ECF subfamily)
MPAAVSSPRTPHDLLELTRAGDPGALAEVYRQHCSAVHAVAFRLTASAADADDVLQDVFVGLPEALRSFDARGSFAGWLRRVAARTALMRMRRSTRRGEVALAADVPAAPAPDAAARVDIERALAALAPGLRVVFVLREVEGYSHAEIAEIIGVRAGTSEVRLHRARQRLRQLLGDR